MRRASAAYECSHQQRYMFLAVYTVANLHNCQIYQTTILMCVLRFVGYATVFVAGDAFYTIIVVS